MHVVARWGRGLGTAFVLACGMEQNLAIKDGKKFDPLLEEMGMNYVTLYKVKKKTFQRK